MAFFPLPRAGEGRAEARMRSPSPVNGIGAAEAAGFPY